MKLFVTGATGFIGSHLLNQAHSRGIPVIGLRRSADSEPRVALTHSPQWVTKDLATLEPEDFGDCDTVIHLAAHSANVPYDTLENCLQANVIDSVKAFRAAKAAGVGRFVVAGTCFEYGASAADYERIPVNAPLRPLGSYPASKAAATMALHALAIELDLSVLQFRIFQAYGPGEAESRFWPSLMRAAASGGDFEMSLGTQLRDFIHVEQIAQAFLDAAADKNFSSRGFQIENLGSGETLSLAEFALREWEAAGAEGRLILGSVPMRPNEMMRIVPEMAGRAPLI
jgi:nucleoside-diphosphate-sugar epimerase